MSLYLDVSTKLEALEAHLNILEYSEILRVVRFGAYRSDKDRWQRRPKMEKVVIESLTNHYTKLYELLLRGQCIRQFMGKVKMEQLSEDNNAKFY